MAAVENRSSGIRTLPWLQESGYFSPIGGEVPDFEPKQYVKPRKSLKVMARESQLAFASTELAWAEAGLEEASIDPERLGVVLGSNVYRSEMTELMELYRIACHEGKFDIRKWGEAMRELYPLWMLKYLPNMAACQVGIAKDARGPINSIIQGDVSSLLALIEAHDTIARGHADAIISGGTSSLLGWIDIAWQGGYNISRKSDAPAEASRPFDAQRDGFVQSEGATCFILESRKHAEARGAKPFGSILGYGRRYEAASDTKKPTGKAVRQAIRAALEMSHVSPKEIGHVNAHGLSTVEDDKFEAQAIHDTLGEVPVTAPKSYMGNFGAASGAAELAISLLAAREGKIPPTLNYETPDPDCPVNVVTEATKPSSPAILALNHKVTGQAVALLVSSEG